MPLPVLGYYPQERSAALRMLVRLVLIVGLVNGLLSAISFAGGLIEGSPPLPPLIDVAIGVGQVIAWVGVSVSCAIVVVAGRGQTFAIGAQLAAVFVDACYFGRSMFQNDQLVSFIVLVCEMMSDWLLPLLVVLVLWRQDMRSPQTTSLVRGE